MIYVLKKNNTSISDINKFITSNSSKKNSTDKIKEHAQKIFRYAVRFEFWKNTDLIGLLAIYLNDINNIYGYITYLGIDIRYRNKGLASKLLIKAIDYAKKNKFHFIKLEVSTNNPAAQNLYKKLNFLSTKKNKKKELMQLNIKNILNQ